MFPEERYFYEIRFGRRRQLTNDDLTGLPSPDLIPSPLGKVFGINVLLKRPFRSEDFGAENRARVALADELANQPRHPLQKLAEIALDQCHAESAAVRSR